MRQGCCIMLSVSLTHKPHQCLFLNLHLFMAYSFWQDMPSKEDLSDYNEVFQVSMYLFYVRCEPPLAICHQIDHVVWFWHHQIANKVLYCITFELFQHKSYVLGNSACSLTLFPIYSIALCPLIQQEHGFHNNLWWQALWLSSTQSLLSSQTMNE